MASVEVYRLQPRSAFHFGERGVGLEETAETFRSDSLFSAICSTIREGWGAAELERLLRAFADSPPFLLSSCFPYAGPVLFFPRPMLAAPVEAQPEAMKRMKGVAFVSWGLFSRWLTGENLSQEAVAENFLNGGRAWVSSSELAGLDALLSPQVSGNTTLWWRGEVTRVTLDRRTSASAVYRCGRLVFREGCGLYFLVRWLDSSYREVLEQALLLLGEAGIGGRRSSGHGQFRPERQPGGMDLPPPAGHDALVTLSLYWPRPEELEAGVLSEPARYDLVSRYGWVYSPDGRAVRRRQVRMVGEGSVLMPVREHLGSLAKVTPKRFTAHEVYRYGLAFPVGVRLAGRTYG